MSTTYSFEGKHIFVTGASSGIGQQIAFDLAQANANLFLVGRDRGRIAESRDRFRTDMLPVWYEGDLIQAHFIEQIALNVTPLNGLVLAAGIVDYTPASMINSEKIKRIFDINFSANVLLIQQLLKKKKLNKGSSIVIISSISCKLGVPGTALYAASKAAISAYAKVLASELSTKSIRVNTIFPGIVKTNLISNEGVLSDHLLDEAEKKYPLGYGTTADVSSQAMYLLSDGSRWITGSEVILDGGHTLI